LPQHCGRRGSITIIPRSIPATASGSSFAASCFKNVTLSRDCAGDQFWLPNIVRAIGQALVLTPISAITTGGIAPLKQGQRPAIRRCCAIWAAPWEPRRWRPC
jgi:hypothetical protein